MSTYDEDSEWMASLGLVNALPTELLLGPQRSPSIVVGSPPPTIPSWRPLAELRAKQDALSARLLTTPPPRKRRREDSEPEVPITHKRFRGSLSEASPGVSTPSSLPDQTAFPDWSKPYAQSITNPPMPVPSPYVPQSSPAGSSYVQLSPVASPYVPQPSPAASSYVPQLSPAASPYVPQPSPEPSPASDVAVGLHTLMDPREGERPEYTWCILIKHAILGSPEKKLKQKQIMEEIARRFPYFSEDNEDADSWKVSTCSIVGPCTHVLCVEIYSTCVVVVCDVHQGRKGRSWLLVVCG